MKGIKIMNKKLMNYNLTVSTTKEISFGIVDKLGSDYLDLITKGSSIYVYPIPDYEDMLVVEINLKDVPFEEVIHFEDELIRLNYLGDNWKTLKEAC